MTDKVERLIPSAAAAWVARVREPLDASRLQDDNRRFGALRSGGRRAAASFAQRLRSGQQ